MKLVKWSKGTIVATVTFLLFQFVTPALAEEKLEPLTLQDAVSTAVQNNPAVIESQKRWEEKTARIPVVTAQPNPKIGIMKDDIPTSSANPFDGMMTDFTLSQEIMNPAKLKVMGKMAHNEANMARDIYNSKKLKISIETKKTYYDLLYATQALAVGKENQQLMGQLAQIAQINYSTGMVSLQDALRAQTEFSKMTVDLLNMASMEAVTKSKLNTLMGRSADIPLMVKEEFSTREPDYDLAVLQKTAAENKPSVQEMKSQLEMAQNGIQLAKKQILPDYEIQLGYKRYKRTDMPETDTPNVWRIGIMAMLPIWHDKNQGQVKAAVAGEGAAQAALANMQNMTALDVQMTLTEAQSTWRQIGLYQNTIVPQAEQTLQAGIINYTNGKVDFMAVLDSVNTLRNARLDYYKAKVNYEKSLAELEKAVGQPLTGILP